MDIIQDVPATIKQELTMASILSLVPVDPDKAKEALKVAPPKVKVVTQLPSQPSKSSSTLTAPSKSVPQQTFSQVVPSK